ncbi:MAG: hypothetical protein ACI909_003018 [Planctomycetota bacterium]|jgi:hypothetical protein
MFYLKSLTFVAISCISLNTLASSDIYIYPNKGQSPQQQSQDRYECHVWAAGQSGFDPSAYSATRPAPVLVASSSGGHYPHRRDLDPITGAAGGAALGALGGAIGGDAGKGAAIGAGVGALAGIFSSAGNHQRNKERNAQLLAQQAAQQAQQDADMEQERASYKRAISACLEAHNYTVK